MQTYNSAAQAESALRSALCELQKPSAFFEDLRSSENLDPWFREVGQLTGIPQNPKYHPEGDVWNHTMLVVDEAAKRRDSVTSPYAFMLAALTHDFGKIICTEEIDGVIHAYKHETKGLPLVSEFLERLGIVRKDKDYILSLVELHMKPNMMALQRVSVKSTNKMFDRAASPEDLLELAACDHFGKTRTEDYTGIAAFLRDRLEKYRAVMAQPHVTKEDLRTAGVDLPDEKLPELLSYAHKLRLAGVHKESALKQVMAYGRKLC